VVEEELAQAEWEEKSRRKGKQGEIQRANKVSMGSLCTGALEGTTYVLSSSE
jgi:hypothetical protein